jgi:ApaG protein
VTDDRSPHPPTAASEAVTNGVRVEVTTRYAPERSQPQGNRWEFHYTVTISNERSEAVQLISRHWIITDDANAIQEVRGLGVVGRQPTLAPGESFEYTSICPLGTPSGSMHGTYQMVSAKGERFNAAIAPFGLAAPYTVH